ncbi:MAG: hypothetical protein H8E41_11140 [Desulfobulbaceae bacterium]|uniref:Portal protein n=1 Tax=Candidatus Desulfobia pelagia TaxID=2841692 RepID=A0A8J6NDG8_9BACT|nr:hypothetical protein [Candidatus Desulfobia pelagia]
METEIIPAKDSDGVGFAVVEMLEEILKYRETIKFAERCNRFYKLRKNKHWKNESSKLLSANLLGAHHQKTVNMLTDSNPTFNAVQAGEMGEDAQDALSLLVRVTDSWYNETEQQHSFEESVHIGELYGSVGEFMSFNPDINFPDGEVETETLDPLYYSLYPPKERKVSKSEAFLRWYPMTLREARRKWPEHANIITGDLSLLQQIGDEREEEQTRASGLKQIVLSSLTRWISGDAPSGEDSDELFVIEAWAKDYSEANGKPVYPGNIRRVRVCNAGEVVLDDEYNPSINTELDEETLQKQYLYSRFPVSHTHSVTDPNSPLGISDFEQLEHLNVEVNKSLSQFTMFKDKVSRPKLINPRDSGVTNDEMDNMAGIINPTNHLVARAIQFVNPPAIPGDLVTAASVYKDFFNEIAGSFNDVMQGQKKGSEVIAAKAIAMLLEEASRMVRGKTRNYSKMLRERGRMFLSLSQSFYKRPRYITFQKNGEDETIAIDRDVLQIPGKINVVSGSTLPTSHIQRREEAISLFKMGTIDQEELLKKLDWDNYTDVVERMREGPIGQYIQKLSMIGIPGQILQMFKQLSKMDDKEIERAVKEGKIPNFAQILKQMSGKQQPDPAIQEAAQKMQIEQSKVQISAQKAQAEIQKSMAQAAKEQADIELIKQKIESEITDRQLRVQEGQIKVAGLELDRDNIKIQKAEAIARIQAAAVKKGRDDKGGYDERGMASNNQEVK